MESTTSNEVIYYIVIGTLVMFTLVVTIILFVNLAQRKAAKQERKMQEMQSKHQKDMFVSVLAAQEKERNRIAKDLHDDIGTSLSATNLRASQLLNGDNEDNEDIINEVISNIENIIIETRRVINDLSPMSLKRFGLFMELEILTRQLNSSANIKVEIQSNISDSRLSDELELTLYRVIKEFCNNTIKYANAAKISLAINKTDNDDLEVLIKDDGEGFDINSIKDKGHGLNNMESRIYLLGGKSILSSNIGVGTELSISMPLTAEDINKLNSEI